MKDVILTLRQQHQAILSMLDKPELVRELIHFVENDHHPLEETTLFPYLQQQEFLNHGGPRCSFFMGMRLDFNPLQSVRLHLKEFYAQTLFQPQPYGTFEWLDNQSPLSIPMEEHFIGAELAQSLLFLLSPEGQKFHPLFFESLYDDYCRLLKLHINKEDNCLFVMCEAKL